MSLARLLQTAITSAAIAVLGVGVLTATAPGPSADRAPLSINTARVTLEGNSNLHPYTASSTDVRLVRAQVSAGVAGPEFWAAVVKPGALEAFEIAIPVAKLASPKEGIDKNMHKALKASEHPDITFRLARLEPGNAAGAYRGVGTLKIAGVEREVALNITTEVKGEALSVKGEFQLLMTDFGIAPPKAMLGMLKTDPKVTVRFETVLAIATT